MMFTVLTGFLPFFDEDNATLKNEIMTGKFDKSTPEWSSFSGEAKDLLT